MKQVVLWDVQYAECPEEVKDEVRQLWRNFELGNDWYYFPWESIDNGEDYPEIDEYLRAFGVTECLIRWWW